LKDAFGVRLSTHLLCGLPIDGKAGKCNRSIFIAEIDLAMFPDMGNFEVNTIEASAPTFK
jgi:hypothetical protein